MVLRGTGIIFYTVREIIPIKMTKLFNFRIKSTKKKTIIQFVVAQDVDLYKQNISGSYIGQSSSNKHHSRLLHQL